MSRRRFDEPMRLATGRWGSTYWRPISCDRYFWQNVVQDQDSDCWLWTGEQTPGGYGRVSRQRQQGGRTYARLVAHRYAYEDLIGEVDPALDLDHLCRNRLCVNPYHLDPGPPAENMRRGRLARGMAA